MGNRLILCFIMISMLFYLYPLFGFAHGGEDISKVHFKSIVVDSHNDTMLKVIDKETWLPTLDLKYDTDNHIDIPKLKKGGLNVLFFAAYTSGYQDNTQRSISRTLSLINALYWTEANNRDTFKITKSLSDIEKALYDGKIAAVPTIEGGYSLDRDESLELLRQYNDLGIKAIALNWNFSNALGEGADRTYNDMSKTPSSGGLTKLGEKVVLEMNRLGMIIDVSHMAESTFWDVINTSKSPIMATHSGVYSLKNHPRNLTDKQLRALANNGGVIGIALYPGFLTKSNQANIKDYVDHIDYVVDLIGIDHVAIGSDFDGARLPTDLKDSSELYNVTDELIARGYKKEDIEKILGKNVLRVLKKVEDLSDRKIREIDNKMYIMPYHKMGEIVSDSAPFLSAKIESEDLIEINEIKSRIIVDGISYNANYNKGTSTLSLKINKRLKEKFHVVTFEITDIEGNIQRSTRIFYIK
ncbi:dipeptidase [Tissierella sp.]|uniref:dipeptidase n=1 Tax=Tissierella sp. TaxID=41274 RepID=UPI00285B3F3C|nr:dipeptidase [Tissierella sp.]MDR7855396.1 dipeptidase [Tissierella sp.]